MKLLLATCAVLAGLTGAASAQFHQDWRGRSPIIYNFKDQEVAVIQHPTSRGGEPGYVIQPTQKYLDLGYYNIAIPASALRPRARGGWVTDITNDEFPNFPPTPPRFFRSSGL